MVDGFLIRKIRPPVLLEPQSSLIVPSTGWLRMLPLGADGNSSGVVDLNFGQPWPALSGEGVP